MSIAYFTIFAGKFNSDYINYKQKYIIVHSLLTKEFDFSMIICNVIFYHFEPV